MQEKCKEQRKLLFIPFDTESIDTVDRKYLYEALEKRLPTYSFAVGDFFSRVHEKIAFIYREIHQSRSLCDVALNNVFFFPADSCFAIYFAVILQYAFDGSEDGVYLKTRFDVSLFYLNRLKSKQLKIEDVIREILFADDALIAARREITLQRLVDRVAESFSVFRLKKTELRLQRKTHH